MTVTRVEVDGATMLNKLGADKIVHDLADDETICPTCKGVGIHKSESPYGLSEEPRKWDDPFPYKHQWLTPCHHCYMGKIRVCLLCKGFLERARTICECKEARAIRDAEAASKEEERRARLPRIDLEDYNLDMVWSDSADRYITTDALGDHLEEYPDDTIFACTEAQAQIAPAADDVIESILTMASEEIEDGEDHVEFKEGHKEALDALLDTWFKEYVKPREVFWQDNGLIIEVPSALREPSDE